MESYREYPSSKADIIGCLTQLERKAAEVRTKIAKEEELSALDNFVLSQAFKLKALTFTQEINKEDVKPEDMMVLVSCLMWTALERGYLKELNPNNGEF